jgi:glycosyltransferase involved in cell wall biosynthesis
MITKFSIIIPAYNEENTIQAILTKVMAVNLINSIGKEIIVVNDCSTDRTKERINEFIEQHPGSSVLLINQETNQGKGAAIHAGISAASGEFLIIQDADLEYDPNEYNILLKPVMDGVADAVFGSRFRGGNPHRVSFFWHSIGNHLLTFCCNIFSNLNMTDMETCYKLMRTDHIKSITLKEKRFGFEPEITIKLSRIPGIRIYEVGVSYYGRSYSEGKKINWKDGFRAIYCILKYGLFRG